MKSFFDIKTNLLNFRDFFRFIRGIWQSYFLIGRLKPSIIFTKGGYVCAPLGISAGLRGVPYITHDSDAMVSLAHRMISQKAELHLTAMPANYYLQYPKNKTVQVGVPIRAEYAEVSDSAKIESKKLLGFDETNKVLLVVGGGLGAKNINTAIVDGSVELLSDPSLVIVHITGHKLFKEVQTKYASLNIDKNRIICMPFSDKLYKYSAMADVIITRAGATNMAELSAQAKACIIVPNPLLAGGHQLKNAEVFENADSAIIVSEERISSSLISTAIDLLNNPDRQKVLSMNLKKNAVLDASDKIAEILVKYSTKNFTPESI